MTINALPDDFTPGPRDVVIGKGKKFYFHAGNAWLRAVVGERIDEYATATSKADKSNLISAVLEYVTHNGQFVKQDFNQGGKWVYAEPLLCREKCSQTFRDYLAETYRSSNVAKRNKRREQRVGSSSDLLINALQSAKISSSTSLKNLQKFNKNRHARSMGNLLLKRAGSSGQFSAAKKASFAKLQNAVVTSGGGGGSGGTSTSATNSNEHHLNATWSPKRTVHKAPTTGGNATLGTMSNRLTAQLRANLRLQQQTMQLQVDLQGMQMNQPPQQVMSGGIIPQQQQQFAQQPTTGLPLPEVVGSQTAAGGPNPIHQQTPSPPMQLPSLEPTPLRQESSNATSRMELPLPSQPSGLVADFHKVEDLEQMRIQLASDWDAVSKIDGSSTTQQQQLGEGSSDNEGEELLPNLIGSSTAGTDSSDNNLDDFDAIVDDLLQEAREAGMMVPTTGTGIDSGHNSHGSFDALLHMPIMECDMPNAA